MLQSWFTTAFHIASRFHFNSLLNLDGEQPPYFSPVWADDTPLGSRFFIPLFTILRQCIGSVTVGRVELVWTPSLICELHGPRQVCEGPRIVVRPRIPLGRDILPCRSPPTKIH